MRFRWLPLTSTRSPSVRGRSLSRVKCLIVCSLPSSKTREVFLVQIRDQRALLVANGKQDVYNIDVDLQDRLRFLSDKHAEAHTTGRQKASFLIE